MKLKHLGTLAGLLLGLASAPAWSQTSCQVQSQAALLAQFSDNAPPGSIPPASVRNVICSTLQNPAGVPFSLDTNIALSGSFFNPAVNSALSVQVGMSGNATMYTTELVAGGYIQPKNIITCNPDTVTANAISGNLIDVPCFEIVSNIGGVSGARAAFRVDANISNFIGTASGSTPDANAGGTAALFTLQANYQLGGTSSAPRGQAGAFGVQLAVTPAASYYFGHIGEEIDVASMTNTFPFNKAGILLAAFDLDNDHASCQSAPGGSNACAIDAGLAITAVGICTGAGQPSAGCTQYGGFNQGILFAGNTHGNNFPVPPSGTLVLSDASVVLRGIDFTQVTFSGSGNCAFCSNDFAVSGGGDIQFSGFLTTGLTNFVVNWDGSGAMFSVVNPAGTGLANYVQIGATAASFSPNIGPVGTDNTINLVLYAKGTTGLVEIGNQNTDYLTVAGSTSSGVTLATSGGGITISPAVTFSTTPVFASATLASASNLAVNYDGLGAMFSHCGISTCGPPGGNIADFLVSFGEVATAGGAVGLTAVFGSDTDVNLSLTPKGAGVVQFGSASSFTANGSVATALSSIGPTGSHTTVQEWLTVKDSAGTVRYVPAF